ncbi:hypothetical protein MCOR25_004469 [Pyricularia grisea]|uniref:MARVEL domain-containing protein n=1 Tax=Pyricularia grisea TaxID=148305 RepID=A0A6P8B121_PYRGI|nr:uncharacterized protein PgNI_06781 [Pyricularia grisea]KAI6369288.1 hypothetical protein MCOR25_004469 [Pyricularia grisea]TLD08413.1 hypothetical protein PgNI_06781 [Pyricularia grisea]
MYMTSLMSHGVPAGQPRWLTGIKVAMILLSLVIVGLSAFAITIIKTFGERRFAGPGSAALFIFTAVKTVLLYVFALVVEKRVPRFFFRVLFVVSYGFSVFFWAATWVFGIRITRFWFLAADRFTDTSRFGDLSARLKKEGSVMAAVTAISFVVSVLTLVHMIFFVKACRSEGPAGPYAQQAELGQFPYKVDGQQGPPMPPPQYPYYPQPAYGGQQPMYPQPPPGQQPMYPPPPSQYTPGQYQPPPHPDTK